MSHFVPPGFITLKEAVRRAAAVWEKSEDASWRTLRGSLYSGAVRSGYLLEGKWTEVSHAWGSQANDRAHHTGRLTFHSVAGGSAVYPALVIEPTLVDLLAGVPQPGPEAPSAAPRATETPRNRGGAPARYDWDRIWVEICAQLYLKGLPEEEKPENKADGGPYAPIVNYILEWCQRELKKEPGRTTVHEKVKAAVDRIRAEPTETGGR